MIFTFNLYRATSKNKSLPRSQRLIINSNDRMHYMQKNNFVDELKILAMKTVAKSHTLPNPLFDKNKPCGVTLTVFTPTNLRIDPDNLQPTLKAIMDGFTNIGLWDDDNHETVKFTKYQYGGLSGDKAYRLEVEVKEV